MLLTPEGSVAAQKSLGADIILPLDELPPFHITEAALAASVARSHRWMARRWVGGRGRNAILRALLIVLCGSSDRDE